MRTMKKHERPEKPKWEFKLDENGKPIWPKRPEMTPERLAAVKYLDELRSASPENAPEVPLSAIVYVQDYEEIPLANEMYALVTVTSIFSVSSLRMFSMAVASVPAGRSFSSGKSDSG